MSDPTFTRSEHDNDLPRYVPDEALDVLDSDEARLILVECRRLLKEVQASQIETASLVKTFIDGIKPAVDEVLPKLESIAESSWFRMITGGKKK